MNYEENFEKLVKYCWSDPEKPESPDNLSIHRQEQLQNILDSYGGNAVPLTHFTDHVVKGSIYVKPKACTACGHRQSKNENIHHLRNYAAFPVVYAYLCGVLVRNEHQLELKDGIELCESDIPRNSYIPPEVRG
jgi:hypothetical protein